MKILVEGIGSPVFGPRIKYMKNNPDSTAWRKKNLSYPERLFLNKLYELKWNEKYNIIREKSVFPYFIDFALVDLKIAIDGFKAAILDLVGRSLEQYNSLYE